jgi:Zn ribbon nucleic-acid-binding protein
MKCPRCKNEMKNVMHFEDGKNFAFHECKKCHTKTHQKRIHFEEVNKNENSSNSKRV